jgi:Kef-type K+ transport system membrane component KefB
VPSLLTILADLSWPFAIAVAWVAGEFGHRWTGLPRISFYGLVGFVLAQSSIGVLPQAGSATMLLMADVALGLILFEMGYRINLRWLRNNPWLLVTGLVEAFGTFAVVYLIANQFGVTSMNALLLAALAMSSSPATVLRVINEERSSGQVTERVLHLTAINCVLAAFTFNVIVGLWIFHSSGDWLGASSSSLAVLLASAGVGALFGVGVPAMLRKLGNLEQDATVAFALSVILLVALTYSISLSPLLATLAFGLVVRHRRVAFSKTQRNFGALGELLTVLLFVFAASTMQWPNLAVGTGLALLVIGARFITKVASVTAFSHVSGISWRKGALTGVALTPVSAFIILLLEHARQSGVDLGHEVMALAAVTLILEVAGPIVFQRALIWAKETQQKGPP